MKNLEPDSPVFDPQEIYEAFNNGEDLQKLALSVEAQKNKKRPPLSETVEELTAIIKSERDRLKAVVLEEAKTDMVLALRQEVNRLVILRKEFLKGTIRRSITEMIDTDRKEVVSRTEQENFETPATAVTNLTREIRENRKLICAILNLADSAAESDEAFEKALEEAGEEGAIVRGEEIENQKSSSGPRLPQGQPNEESSLSPTDRDDQAGGEAHSG